MARSNFAGSSDDFLFYSSTAGATQYVALANATLTVWSAETGGTQYTDLLDADGNAITVVQSSSGFIPDFQGPDSVSEVWADGGAGRFLLVSSDGAASAAASAASATAAASAATAQATDAAASAAAAAAPTDAMVASLVPSSTASATTVALAKGFVSLASAPTGSDDTSLLQALFNASAHGAVRLQPNSTYKLTGSTGLTIDSSKRSVLGDGTKIDASGMTSGVAVTISGTDSGFNSSARGGFQGIELIGPGASSSVTGLLMKGAGTTGQNTEQVNLHGTVIHDFHIGISEGSYAWAYNMFGISVYNCTNAIDDTASTADSGERLTYIGCTIFNNTLAVNDPSAREHLFIGCSFDFNPELIRLTGPGSAKFIGCHVEHLASTAVPIGLNGTNPLVVVDDSSWCQHSDCNLQTALVAGTAVTSLTVQAVQTVIASGDTIKVCTPGSVDTFTASAACAIGDTTIPVTSAAPTYAHAVGARVYDYSALPQYVVSSSAASQNARGVWFRNTTFTGVATTSGSLAAGGAESTACWLDPPLIDGTIVNPNNGQPIVLPAVLAAQTDVAGTLRQQTVAATVTGSYTIDYAVGSVFELNVTTTGAVTLSAYANTPSSYRTMEVMVVVYNGSGGTLGTITWPSPFQFNGLTWTNPASAKRRHLTARYAPSYGKWIVTAVASADY